MSRWVVPTGRSVRISLSAGLDAVGFHTVGSREDRALLGLPEADHVCFVLVDGLGYHNLNSRSGHARTLRAWESLEPMTTVAPSTTAAAITALGTGREPGETAMTSYALRSPATGKNFSLIKWEGSGLDPLMWQTCPTLFEELLAQQAESCVLIQPREFIASGLTQCALRGARAIPANTANDRIDAAASALRRGAKAAYLYWGELDHTGHSKGWMSEDWVEDLEELDAAMAELARRVPRGTLIILTADHGMIDVTRRFDVAEEPQLACEVELVSGEERAAHLYTEHATAVAERWQEFFGADALIYTKAEIATNGLMGPLADRTKETMGDVLVFVGGTDAVIDSRQRRPNQSFMVGVHGSLTEQEMRIPLLVEVA
ncbi:MAG: alkaline phosphatase family protein [Ancrocorticia populi]|uniref:alkaline phosphatase family protein n=1 Tax=Ancrocorticia populi TaxID=2175228 RepID=UPI003F9311B5